MSDALSALPDQPSDGPEDDAPVSTTSAAHLSQDVSDGDSDADMKAEIALLTKKLAAKKA